MNKNDLIAVSAGSNFSLLLESELTKDEQLKHVSEWKSSNTIYYHNIPIDVLKPKHVEEVKWVDQYMDEHLESPVSLYNQKTPSGNRLTMMLLVLIRQTYIDDFLSFDKTLEAFDKLGLKDVIYTVGINNSDDIEEMIRLDFERKNHRTGSFNSHLSDEEIAANKIPIYNSLDIRLSKIMIAYLYVKYIDRDIQINDSIEQIINSETLRYGIEYGDDEIGVDELYGSELSDYLVDFYRFYNIQSTGDLYELIEQGRNLKLTKKL